MHLCNLQFRYMSNLFGNFFFETVEREMLLTGHRALRAGTFESARLAEEGICTSVWCMESANPHSLYNRTFCLQSLSNEPS